MIKVCCLQCGHSLTLGEAYDEYAGKIRCWGCGAVLELALEAGKLRSMHIGRPSLPPQDDSRPRAHAPPPARELAPPGRAAGEVDGDEC